MNISALNRAYAPVPATSKPATTARSAAASNSPDVVVQISAAGRAAAGVTQFGPLPVDRVGPWPVDRVGPWPVDRVGPWGD